GAPVVERSDDIRRVSAPRKGGPSQIPRNRDPVVPRRRIGDRVIVVDPLERPPEPRYVRTNHFGCTGKGAVFRAIDVVVLELRRGGVVVVEGIEESGWRVFERLDLVYDDLRLGIRVHGESTDAEPRHRCDPSPELAVELIATVLDPVPGVVRTWVVRRNELGV